VKAGLRNETRFEESFSCLICTVCITAKSQIVVSDWSSGIV